MLFKYSLCFEISVARTFFNIRSYELFVNKIVYIKTWKSHLENSGYFSNKNIPYLLRIFLKLSA